MPIKYNNKNNNNNNNSYCNKKTNNTKNNIKTNYNIMCYYIYFLHWKEYIYIVSTLLSSSHAFFFFCFSLRSPIVWTLLYCILFILVYVYNFLTTIAYMLKMKNKQTIVQHSNLHSSETIVLDAILPMLVLIAMLLMMQRLLPLMMMMMTVLLCEHIIYIFFLYVYLCFLFCFIAETITRRSWK